MEATSIVIFSIKGIYSLKHTWEGKAPCTSLYRIRKHLHTHTHTFSSINRYIQTGMFFFKNNYTPARFFWWASLRCLSSLDSEATVTPQTEQPNPVNRGDGHIRLKAAAEEMLACCFLLLVAVLQEGRWAKSASGVSKVCIEVLGQPGQRKAAPPHFEGAVRLRTRIFCRQEARWSFNSAKVVKPPWRQEVQVCVGLGRLKLVDLRTRRLRVVCTCGHSFSLGDRASSSSRQAAVVAYVGTEDKAW